MDGLLLCTAAEEPRHCDRAQERRSRMSNLALPSHGSFIASPLAHALTGCTRCANPPTRLQSTRSSPSAGRDLDHWSRPVSTPVARSPDRHAIDDGCDREGPRRALPVRSVSPARHLPGRDASGPLLHHPVQPRPHLRRAALAPRVIPRETLPVAHADILLIFRQHHGQRPVHCSKLAPSTHRRSSDPALRNPRAPGRRRRR